MNTDLIKKSKEKGATIIYGYEMLLGQATRAFEIWHGVKAPYEAMKRAILGGF
jgi:shikimate dehydrogenase